MATPITIPRLGWNMEQGAFVGWLKADGASVRAGEMLFTVESEKSTEDVENFEDGILHIPANGPSEGDILAVGAVIGFVLQPGEPIPKPASSTPPAPTTIAAKTQPVVEPTPEPSDARLRSSSPRARKTAARMGVDWRHAAASGSTGRIRERDVLALAEPASSMSTTRRTIAERMQHSHLTTAPVTLTTTADASELVRLRNQYRQANDVVPSYTDFFIKFAAQALVKHPVLNSRWEARRIMPGDGIHIGVAVDTEQGLLVPVVRDVPGLSLEDLARRTRDLIDRARAGRLSAADMRGGTFTVTSLGAFGIDGFTPIINVPECAVLGIGRIKRCPVVVEDEIAIRDQVTLSLTFDHRIVDGAPAARFLQSVCAALEKGQP